MKPALSFVGIASFPCERAAVDGADARNHPLRAEALLLPAGQQCLLGEAALVDEQRDALAHRQLALLARLRTMPLGPAREGTLSRYRKVCHGSCRGR